MKRFLLAAGSYLSVIILVFGKVLYPSANLLIYDDDIQRVYYFYRQFFNYFLSRGIFPWWNPYLFGGTPFIANPVVNIWYPPNWLFIVLPLNLAYPLHLAIHILIAMLGMRWLLKRVIGESGGLGALAGGLIFGLSGFFMARIWAGHVDVIAAASWMPWVVGAFWKILCLPAQLTSSHSGNLKIIIASIFFAVQLYAGYQTMAFFTVEAVGIVTLFHCYFVKSLRPLWRVLLAGLLGLGLAGLQIIPEQEFFRSSIRTYNLPYSWNSYGAITWENLGQLFSPFYQGDQLTYRGVPPNYPEQAMYVGVAALVLAVLALLKSLKEFKVEILAFAAIAVFGLWMALGPHAPFDLQRFFWQVLPAYKYLRIPARHLILFIFGVSALAGIGFNKIREIRPTGKIGELLVVGLILWELVPFGQHFIATKEVPEVRHDQQLIELLKKDKEPYRLLQNFGVWLPQRDALDFDSAGSYRIFSATGYDPSILRNYYEYVAGASGKSGIETILAQDVQVPYLTVESGNELDILNVKYLMVPLKYDPFAGNPRYRLISESAKNAYRLYENTTVLPRFYLADRSCGDVNISSYTPNRIELVVENTCGTKLLSSEVWYPGWKALVDGRKTVIDKTNNVFRTLFVQPGKHTIIYVYEPTIFYISGGVSLLTGIFLITLFLRRKN